MYEHNGKMYARVSEIIAPFADFSGIDPDILSRKADLGTRVHAAIDEEIHGGMGVLDSKAAGYFQSWEKWRAQLNPTFEKTEMRLFCDLRMITGQIDALILFPGENKPILCDWKTSANESHITWPMQANLYYYLLVSNGIDVQKRFLFIKLDRYGYMPTAFCYHLDQEVMGKCMEAIKNFWADPKNVDYKSSDFV